MRVHVFVCVCVCVYVCVCACVHVCVYVCVFVHAHVCEWVCVRLCAVASWCCLVIMDYVYLIPPLPPCFLLSWSPRGVLLASKNGAKYLWDGKVVEVPPGGAVMESAQHKSIFSKVPLPLEGYPNRNSLNYKEVYNIPEAITVLRGTLRYQVHAHPCTHTHTHTHTWSYVTVCVLKGFCSVMSAIKSLGLLSNDQHQRLSPGAADLTWVSVTCHVIGSA